MRRIFYLVFFTVLTVNAQNGLFKLKSVSAGFSFHTSNKKNLENGLAANADISTSFKNHLVSLHYNSGLEITTPFLDFSGSNLDQSTYSKFLEFNLTYGRELEIKKWMTMEGHVGLGYIGFSESHEGKYTTKTVGLPIRFKLLFYIKNFGMGLNPNANLNSINNMYSGNLIFQYRFN